MSSQSQPESLGRTPAQATASRLNAQHSTGPRTRLGKLRIRHNGVKHGLYAATAPMIGERRRDFRRLHAMLVKEYAPATPIETMLVQRAASLLWRLGRVPAAENALFESFGGEAARALREAEGEEGQAESDEVSVDLLWGLAFRAGIADSPVNRLARWERSLHLQLREVWDELARRQAERRVRNARPREDIFARALRRAREEEEEWDAEDDADALSSPEDTADRQEPAAPPTCPPPHGGRDDVAVAADSLPPGGEGLGGPNRPHR